MFRILLRINYWRNNNNEYKKDDNLSQWISFIKADSKEVLQEMAKVNPKIDKAVNVLETMCQDKKARAEYLSREMALHDEATRIEEAMEEGYEKGVEQGIEQGIEKANINNALNLLKLGVEESIISQATGLSIEKIKELKKDLDKES